MNHARPRIAQLAAIAVASALGPVAGGTDHGAKEAPRFALPDFSWRGPSAPYVSRCNQRQLRRRKKRALSHDPRRKGRVR